MRNLTPTPLESAVNDPARVIYPSAHPAVVRSSGSTPSEQYLAKLADRSFLNLWSYPNVFIDRRVRGKGDGKELCDLLIVCGDHVLIFSDKTVSWPVADDVQLGWKRWYKRAILKSVEQIRGAERWVDKFPNRIFLDRQCTQPLPIPLPPPERRKVHGIVVALGAGDACKRYFGEGIGSLAIAPHVRGAEHWANDSVLPFVVGDVDPEGPFVHVLDDATLDIVMRELDTITDFEAYLTKKELLVRSGRLIAAGGEEDLVAYYMTHMNSQGEHDFTKPDGTDLGETDHLTLEPGFYASMLKNSGYRAKKLADGNSYIWDNLIEQFTTHMLAGTTLVPDGQEFDIGSLEQGVRHMALVPRYLRRSLGDSILDALQKGTTADRFTRAMIPGPTEADQDTGFFFMTLAVPAFQLDGGYEQYRLVRHGFLETYALAFLKKYPKLKRIIGIATEPPGKGRGASEDLILVERGEWTPEFERELAERMKALNIAQEGNFKEYSVQGREFPEIPNQDIEVTSLPGLNRHQRRAEKAKLRKLARRKLK